jgi:ubiquinone biosynthesis protein
MRNPFRILWRFLRISWSVLVFVIIPGLKPGASTQTRAERLRRAFEDLGGVWIKVGQTLALRFDLLPAEYCNEFLKLLSEVKTFPYEDVRIIIKKELGGYPEELFASFDPKPIAAASIAQVHKATAFDGRILAVKVQRPKVRRLFLADLQIMRFFAFGLDSVGALGGTSLRSFVDEFARWTIEEVNFRIEARNAYRMSLFARDDPNQVNARVAFEYSSDRVLTTEFMDGILVLDIVRAIQTSDTVYLQSLRDRGYDLKIIAERICWNMLNQMFRDSFFHADMHPANIFVLPGNRIGYVDFGIAGRLSDDLQISLRHYVRNLFQANFDAAIAELLRWNTPSFATDLDAARRDLLVALEDYRYGLGQSGTGGPLQLTSGFLTTMMSVMRRHQLAMSESLILYFKALLTTDAVIFELSPRFDLFEALHTFFFREFKMDARTAFQPAVISDSIQDIGHQSAQFIADIGRIQNTGRLLEIALETAQARFVFYAICAIILATCAYVVNDDRVVHLLQSLFGFEKAWLSSLLMVLVVVFLALLWRQSRNLSAVDRRTVTRRDAFDRSLGRQR